VIVAGLKDTPKYKPKEIMADDKRDRGVGIGYNVAERTKAQASTVHAGDFDRNYALVSEYCHQVQLANPDSA
jgi:hypothetical protein